MRLSRRSGGSSEPRHAKWWFFGADVGQPPRDLSAHTNHHQSHPQAAQHDPRATHDHHRPHDRRQRRHPAPLPPLTLTPALTRDWMPRCRHTCCTGFCCRWLVIFICRILLLPLISRDEKSPMLPAVGWPQRSSQRGAGSSPAHADPHGGQALRHVDRRASFTVVRALSSTAQPPACSPAAAAACSRSRACSHLSVYWWLWHVLVHGSRVSVCFCCSGMGGATKKSQNQEWPFPSFSLFTYLGDSAMHVRCHSVCARACVGALSARFACAEIDGKCSVWCVLKIFFACGAGRNWRARAREDQFSACRRRRAAPRKM